MRTDPAQVLLLVHDHVGGRAPGDLAGLPRRASLERLVLERAAGGEGGVASGHLGPTGAAQGRGPSAG